MNKPNIPSALILANLSLLILFPLAWFAPFLRAGLVPFLGLDEVSIITGLQQIWAQDVFLALVVTFFALFAPIMKTFGLALIHFDLMSQRLLPAMTILGKLAMADVFLLAIFIISYKGVGIGTVETAWGLYLFTGCVLASFAITFLSKKT